MTSPVFYILVSLMLSSAMMSLIFFLIWKTLGEKPYALSWAIGFLAATAHWFISLVPDWFPNYQTYWLTVNALALIVITLGLRGHRQRTNCAFVPKALWPFAVAVFAGVVWTTLVDRHVGISTALLPVTAAVSLFLSALAIIKHREKSRPAEIAAAIMIAVFGFTRLVASALTMTQGRFGDEVYSALYIQFNFLTLPAAYTGMVVFIVAMLASDLLEQSKEIAIQDQLTDMLNRRGFGEYGAKTYAMARRLDRPVAVIMSDIDRFKNINDKFGHAVGDLALVHFANILKNTRRADDILARVGGEEFAIILPGTKLKDAMQIADDLCLRLESSPFEVDGVSHVMTASFGVASLSSKDTCLSDVIVRADRALYRSKRAGRNRVDLESSQFMRAIDGSLEPVKAS